MAGPSRSVNPLDPTMVDDFYFSALFDDDEIFPISDEKYAEELALQEALVSATSRTNKLIIPKKEIKEEREDFITTSHFQTGQNFEGKKVKLENVNLLALTTTQSSPSFCVICMDSKPTEEMFKNCNCSHLFCSYCIVKYVGSI